MSRRPRHDWFGLVDFPAAAARAAPGAVCILLETVGSTSDFLLGRGGGAVGRVCRWDGWGWQAEPQARLLPLEAPAAGTVAFARRQTHGRGRMGRAWVSTSGLMMSWVVPPLPARRTSALAMWTGLVAALALREEFGLDVALKWPNDLVVGGRKLGGVLIDAARARRGPLLVAGLGVNLGSAAAQLPAVLRGQATSVWLEARRSPTVAAVGGAILARFFAELPRFGAEGWEPYRAPLEACDHLRGRRVELATGRGVLRGEACGVDASGALLLRREDGREIRVLAGDVHVLGTAAPEPPREGEAGARARR